MSDQESSPSIPVATANGQNRPVRVVVAHPVQQHSMRTAVAVKRSGADLTYCTPIYDRPNSITARLKKYLTKESRLRASGRKIEGLDDGQIVQKSEVIALVLLLLQRIPFTRTPFKWWMLLLDAVFAARVAPLARRADVLIAYDTFALSLFSRLEIGATKPIKVIDMSAPSIPFVDELLNEYANNPKTDPFLARELRVDNQGVYGALKNQRATKEIKLADHFLVASRFTAKSLESLGVDPGRIHFCRYGGPLDINIDSRQAQPTDEVIRVIFVGRVTGRKGATTFSDAANKLKSENMEFISMGQVYPDSQVGRANSNVRYLGHRTKPEVLKQMSQSHIMVFPSFADGFGFAALEAMASGCAVIVSRNAGISDLIEHGQNGLLFDAGDVRTLVSQLRLLNTDRELLSRIASNGVKAAARQDWNSYEYDVSVALENILAGGVKR